MSKAYQRKIPWVMVLSRASLGPLIVVLGRTGAAGWILAACTIYALVSDIFDGILARRWKTDTAALRISDSLADTIFYLGVVASVWFRFPWAVLQNRRLLIAVIGLEIVRYRFDLLKFGRMASYHSYMAKAWGLILALAVIWLLWTGRSGWALKIALWMGIATNLEGLVMSLILNRWHRDVKSLWRAKQLDAQKEIAVEADD